jgi:hypothetical protein
MQPHSLAFEEGGADNWDDVRKFRKLRDDKLVEIIMKDLFQKQLS